MPGSSRSGWALRPVNGAPGCNYFQKAANFFATSLDSYISVLVSAGLIQ
jgi:hypothetical protein